MGRKKEMVEVNGLAVETVSAEESFMEDMMQQGESESVEEGLNPGMESGADGSGDMADDADDFGEDTLADFLEEENSLMESAEDAEEEMLEGEQRDEIRERQDMGGADICENGENEKETFMDEASELAENAIGLKDATMEAAAEEPVVELPAPARPKRSSRKKKTVPDNVESGAEDGFPAMDADYGDALTLDSGSPEDVDEWDEAYDETEGGNAAGAVGEAIEETVDEALATAKGEAPPSSAAEKRQADPAPRRAAGGKRAGAPVLTLEARGEVETEESREDAIWHEIHNAYRTRRILTGQLGGIEQTDNGKTIAIVDYKGFRIVIPLKEMMINVGRNPSGQEYAELMLRQNKILGNMLGAEIDFIVKGIDSKARSVVASRRDAMLKKRQIFYLDTDASGMYRVHEGRIVQARVTAVAEKVLRVEVFGVECSIMARDLAWDWIGDAHERFSVGDQVLVRVLSVRRDGLEDIAVKADIKSVSQNTSHDNLKKCRIQSKYAGKVTDIHKGVVYIRLSNGVNAVAHSCYDYRTPGKKDDVSFAVTRLDEERGVAVGIITRILRRNL
nr:S1 RNA-binding domain-containing protein [uncultured Acetatifactor sp.]